MNNQKTMDGVVYFYNTETKDVSWDPPNLSDDGANEEWTWVPQYVLNNIFDI